MSDNPRVIYPNDLALMESILESHECDEKLREGLASELLRLWQSGVTDQVQLGNGLVTWLSAQQASENCAH